MTTFNKKAFKGLPAAIRVRKPRYYYQDLVIKNATESVINVDLVKYPGVPYKVYEKVVDIDEATLWNRTEFKSGTYALALKKTEEKVKSGGYNVIGSPTIQGRVISNFSANDYLTLPYVELGKGGTGAWEVNLKVTPSNADLTVESPIISCDIDSRGFRIGTGGTTKGRWEFLVSSGSSWINASAHCGSHVVQAGVTYWLKAGYDGSNYYLKYSTDGIEYINDVSYSSTAKISSFREQVGYIILNSSLWHGSIDLSEWSFTNEGETVWQPAVIETVVETEPTYLTKCKKLVYDVYGAPTITDHVVSNITSSNFIGLPMPFNPPSKTFWEIGMKFTTGSTFLNQAYLMGQYSTNRSTPQICTADDGTLWIYLASNINSWGIANGLQSTEMLEPDTTYNMSMSFDGEGIYKVLIQKEGTDTWTEFFNIASTASVATAATKQLIFGFDDGNGAWNGTIDLKGCYVQIGNDIVWSSNTAFKFEGKGCLMEGADNHTSPTTYYTLYNGVDTLLSHFDWNDHNNENIWVGDIKTQSRLVYPMYKKNFKEVGNLTKDVKEYYYTGFASGKYISATIDSFDPAKDTILFMTRVKTGDDGSNRMLVCSELNNRGLHTGSSKKWYLWDGKTSVAGGAFDYNTWYYVLIRQTPTQAVMYYMPDDGTYPELDNKFPLDLDKWTVGPANAPIFLHSDIRLGLNVKDAELWEGQIDMLNTAIYKSVPKYFEGPDIYSKVWSALEEV
jgi:hypothetical protein